MKAIALISGGLDSILAAKIIERQGIEVVYLNFRIPFCHKDRDGAGNKIARNFGIDLKTVDLSQEFLEIVKSPAFGFGSNMNPCIDCKILMLTRAKELMQEWDAKFVATGEVLGQRPMSQNRKSLKLIEESCGLKGLLLRPLSARVLEETIPEKLGWVDRVKLLNFGGRSRRPQMELAEDLGINNYPNPAGGCLLTDPGYSKRLEELIKHKELTLENTELLKIGRHFRLAADVKLIVGRNEKENMELSRLAKENDYLFYPRQDLAGPTALGRGSLNEESVKLCASIACHYCDESDKIDIEIVYRKIPGGEQGIPKVAALAQAQLVKLRL